MQTATGMSGVLLSLDQGFGLLDVTARADAIEIDRISEGWIGTTVLERLTTRDLARTIGLTA